MFKSAKPIFLIVETSLHAGSGSDLGIVDLPIQREKHTDYPKIEASGIKGAIREVFSTQPNLAELKRGWNITSITDVRYEEAINLTFGPDSTNQNNLHAGAFGFTDARLLLFPIKSVSGVFGWITCPAVLERFKQDLQICGICFPHSITSTNHIPDGSNLVVADNKVVLEEYTFDITINQTVNDLASWLSERVLPADDEYGYWREKMRTDLVVLSDDDFCDFVTLSTEVIARIKINQDTGIVQKGALWYEEYLPSDSILYSLALTSPIFQENDANKGIFQLDAQDKKEGRDESEKVMEFFEDGLPAVIQLGGNATIGKGIVRTKIYED